MASRIFWVMISGLALVTGMVLQDGRHIFSWVDDQAGISAKTERAIDRSVDRAVDRSVDHMQVIGPDGNEIQAPPELKRALAAAVGELVKAEADLAVLKVRDGSDKEVTAASARRDAARAEVDRLKLQIKGQEAAARAEHEAVAQDVGKQIRDEIRESVRDAVRN